MKAPRADENDVIIFIRGQFNTADAITKTAVNDK